MFIDLSFCFILWAFCVWQKIILLCISTQLAKYQIFICERFLFFLAIVGLEMGQSWVLKAQKSIKHIFGFVLQRLFSCLYFGKVPILKWITKQKLIVFIVGYFIENKWKLKWNVLLSSKREKENGQNQGLGKRQKKSFICIK